MEVDVKRFVVAYLASTFLLGVVTLAVVFACIVVPPLAMVWAFCIMGWPLLAPLYFAPFLFLADKLFGGVKKTKAK